MVRKRRETRGTTGRVTRGFVYFDTCNELHDAILKLSFRRIYAFIGRSRRYYGNSVDVRCPNIQELTLASGPSGVGESGVPPTILLCDYTIQGNFLRRSVL